jgi:hypothetical protein
LHIPLKRGDRRWKQAQRQTRWRHDSHYCQREKIQESSSIMREKSYNSKSLIQSKKNPNLYTWEEGPAWASLWIDRSVCSWCLGKRPILRFLVLGNLGLSPSFPDTLKHRTASTRLGPSLRCSKEAQARSPTMNQKMYEAFKFQGKPNGVDLLCPATQCRILKLMLGSFKFDIKFKPVLGEYWMLLILKLMLGSFKVWYEVWTSVGRVLNVANIETHVG